MSLASRLRLERGLACGAAVFALALLVGFYSVVSDAAARSVTQRGAWSSSATGAAPASRVTAVRASLAPTPNSNAPTDD